MRNLLLAGVAAATVCTTMTRPAEAWGGGFLFGTAVGLTAGAVVGAALVHPYPYGPYPYPYGYPPAYPAPYAYGYPPGYAVAPGYAVPPGYAVLPGYAVPTGYAVPPGYAPPMAYAPGAYAAPLRQPTGYAAPAVPQGQAVSCRSGQFFNSLTGTCDR